MKAIIAQGGAFYGVSVKLVTDEEAEEIIKRHAADRGAEAQCDAYASWQMPCAAVDTDYVLIFVCDVKGGKFGYDTGVMKECFDVIEAL